MINIDSIGITVSDLQQSLQFYTDVLSFTQASPIKHSDHTLPALVGIPDAQMMSVRLQLGSEFIELIQYTSPIGRPIPIDSRSNDHWFQHIAIIVTDMDKAYNRLREHKVEPASTSPQTLPDWNPAAGGIQAYYFRDPDGNHLEILQFPPDKGDSKWHRPSSRLFLGIDHTAFVVNDTETSLKFYRDKLGLRIAGTSVNYGIEQARLNNVANAHLRITNLKPTHGPGIELLEYLKPRNGRPMPADSQTNDLWYWQIQMTSNDSHPPASLKEATNINPDEMLRDPDGHALLLM